MSTDSKQFSSLALSTEMLNNIQSLNYQEMTAIQASSLPAILQGKDVQAQAKTGSGKTVAFAIGLLHKLNVQHYCTQALIICPTRELADQVSKEIRRLARPIANTKLLTLCGGAAMIPQRTSLERQPHIVVGTPGRLLKHLQEGTLKLNKVSTLVLDEADRMLDMGFYDDIMQILRKTPKNKQTLLFSATYPEEIQEISQSVQQDPLHIQVDSLHDDSKIKQLFYETGKDQRTASLIKLLQHYQPESSIVFCNRKQQCQELQEELKNQGMQALTLHGDLEQRDRDQVLLQFANKSCSLLIATDVAARGLDIKELHAVINYELSPDPEVHIHRIGRTGRADKDGLALSLFMPSERSKVERIEEFQTQPVSIQPVASLEPEEHFKVSPTMVTLCINAGRKDKIRAGDILGALTANSKLPGAKIGKIDIFDKLAYVAVERAVARQALKILSDGKIKGRRFRVRKL